MARYRDDDDDDRPRRRRDDRDDRDDRPRRQRRDYDDGPPPKSNTGMILLIVGLAVGIPLLACGGVVVWAVMEANKKMTQYQATFQSEMAAELFLSDLEFGNVSGAYYSTTPNFQAKTTLDQFDQLVKANPALTSTHYASTVSTPTPTGTTPNRTVSLVYTVSPDTYAAPQPPGTPAPKSTTCTITLIEQAGGTWKVDGFSIP